MRNRPNFSKERINIAFIDTSFVKRQAFKIYIECSVCIKPTQRIRMHLLKYAPIKLSRVAGVPRRSKGDPSIIVEDNDFDWSYVIILIKTALRLLKLHQVMNFKPNNREIG